MAPISLLRANSINKVRSLIFCIWGTSVEDNRTSAVHSVATPAGRRYVTILNEWYLSRAVHREVLAGICMGIKSMVKMQVIVVQIGVLADLLFRCICR